MPERLHVRDWRVAVLARQLHRAEGVEPAGGRALRAPHLRLRPHRALHGAGTQFNRKYYQLRFGLKISWALLRHVEIHPYVDYVTPKVE